MPFGVVRRRREREREAGEGGQAFREVEQRKNGGKERRCGLGWPGRRGSAETATAWSGLADQSLRERELERDESLRERT